MSGHRGHVLVVDDDEGVPTAVAWALEADGFVVVQAADGLTALEQCAVNPPSLLVLDLTLPGVGGLDVLQHLRSQEKVSAREPLPIIVLSGRNSEADRISGLDLGADDYLVKPFSPGELAARVRSALRRTRPSVSPVPTNSCGVTVDRQAREALLDGELIELTAKEFDLLAYLMDNPRTVLTRARLLAEVWGSEPGWQSESTVTEHIYRLRAKLHEDPKGPQRIRTVRGVGYLWEPR